MYAQHNKKRSTMDIVVLKKGKKKSGRSLILH